MFESFSLPSRRSAIEPATRSTPSSRAVSRAQRIEGPSSGSAPAVICSSLPSTDHFSGRTISSAPSAAAARVSLSAAAAFRSLSAVELS